MSFKSIRRGFLPASRLLSPPSGARIKNRNPLIRSWVALSVVLPFVGCGDDPLPPVSARPPVTVDVQSVVSSPLQMSVRLPGLVHPKARIKLSFRVTGVIERFHVDEGDRVSAGTILAELERDDFEREVRGAEVLRARNAIEVERAKRGFRREEKLAEGGVSSHSNFDDAEIALRLRQSAFEEAGISLEGAKERLTRTRLIAPIDAYVERRLFEEHEFVSALTPAFVLVDIDTVIVRGSTPASYSTDFGIGQVVQVRSRLWPERVFEGRIVRIDVAADPSTRMVPFEVELRNIGLALRPESVVEVEIPYGSPEGTVTAPVAAILRDVDARPFCFIVGGTAEKPIAERRSVTLGRMTGEKVVITSGLSSGDSLIVRGQNFLRGGGAIRFVEQ